MFFAYCVCSFINEWLLSGVVGAILVFFLGSVIYCIRMIAKYRFEHYFQSKHEPSTHNCSASSYIEKVSTLRSRQEVCSYR
jgi:hypothetical protein